MIPTLAIGGLGLRGRPAAGGGGGGGAAVTRLLHFNGTNGSTTITDEAGSTCTATNSVLTTTSPKFGSACLDTGTSSGYVKSDNNSGLDFGTGDFCIEQFVNWNSLINRGLFHLHAGLPSNQGDGIGLQYASGNLYTYEGGSSDAGAAISASTGTWYHVAVYRVGTSLYTAFEGTVVATKGSATTSLTGMDLFVGLVYATSYTFPGTIDEVRVTKGSGVYSTSGFTPPSAEFSYP